MEFSKNPKPQGRFKNWKFICCKYQYSNQFISARLRLFYNWCCRFLTAINIAYSGEQRLTYQGVFQLQIVATQKALEKLQLFDHLQAISSAQIKSISNDFYTNHIVIMDYGDFTRKGQRFDLYPHADIHIFGVRRESDDIPLNDSEKISVTKFQPRLAQGLEEIAASHILIIAEDDED
jgi:hypothetical protein